MFKNPSLIVNELLLISNGKDSLMFKNPSLIVNELLLISNGKDMIWSMKKQSNSNSDVKCTSVQFYSNSHNSQSYRWIELKFSVESPDMFFYLGLKCKINRISEGVAILVG